MTTILPQLLPPATAPSAGQVLSPLTVVGASSAAVLAALESGAVVEAQVQGKDASGQIVVSTDRTGQLVLAAKGAAAELLVPGANIAVQVVTTSGGQLALRLLSVNDLMLARPLTLTLPSPQAPTDGMATPNPGVATSSAQPTTPVQPGMSPPSLGLVATMLRPASAAPAAPPTNMQTVPTGTGGPSPPQQGEQAQPTIAVQIAGKNGGLPSDLPVGTTVAVRILEVIVEPNAAVPASANAEAFATAGSEAAPTAKPAAENSAPTTVPGQTPTADEPQGSPEPSANGQSSGGAGAPVLDGKVVTVIPGQRATVATPVGLLALPAVPDLKAEAAVRLEVISAPVPPAADDGPSDRFADPIKTLNAALTELTTGGDVQSAQKLLSIIPQLGTSLAAGLAVFIKAMDRQTGRAALDDDAVEDLSNAGRKGVAERMAGAFRQLAESVDDRQGQDGGVWRGFTVPLATPDQLIQPVHFYVRQPSQDHRPVDPDERNDGSGGVSKGRDQRFIVELMLSRLGRFQMDGLVQRADKRFDLIVRTNHPLSKDMRNDITDLFITTTEAAGSRGSVAFQTGGRFVAMMVNADHAKLTV